jgi:hypothetical protein
MNANKKNLILLATIVLFQAQTNVAQIKTTLVSTTEESFNNTNFKHIINSNQFEEQFFVNAIPVLEDDYYQKLDEAEQIEREQRRKKEVERRKAKIEFAVTAQNKITSKLILNIIDQIEETTPKLQHPALANYLLFSSETIPSRHEFEELVAIISYIKREIPKLIASHDTPRLEFYESKLSPYPEKLELLFRSSVNEAIEKSDNTSSLKELLELIADE